MKDIQQIEKWLHGTLRAWLVVSDEEIEARLFTEAIALIWTLDTDAAWAVARETFDCMIEDLRAEIDGAASEAEEPAPSPQPEGSRQ